MTFLRTATAVLFMSIGSVPAYAFEPIISLGGEHREIHPNGVTDYILATTEETGGGPSFLILSSPAPGDGPGPAIVHAERAEYWYVLEGTYEFHVGDKVVVGGPGTFIASDMGQKHGFISQSAGKLLVVFAPGGYEEFFMEWDRLDLERGPELGKLENKYGVTRP